MIARFSRLSLLWKILLSTSVAVTLLFALTGWIVLRNAVQTTTSTMEDELGASFQAYQSLVGGARHLAGFRQPDLEPDVGRALGIRHPRPGHHSRHRQRALEQAGHQEKSGVPGRRRGRQRDRIGGRHAGRRTGRAHRRGPLPGPGFRLAAARRTPVPNGFHAGLSGECSAKRAGSRIRGGRPGSAATESRHRRQRVSLRLRRPAHRLFARARCRPSGSLPAAGASFARAHQCRRYRVRGAAHAAARYRGQAHWRSLDFAFLPERAGAPGRAPPQHHCACGCWL